MLEIGSKAPEFCLLNQDGEETALSDFRGKKVVLYFYSKDNTAGCTKQACNFGELYPQFMEKVQWCWELVRIRWLPIRNLRRNITCLLLCSRIRS